MGILSIVHYFCWREYGALSAKPMRCPDTGGQQQHSRPSMEDVLACLSECKKTLVLASLYQRDGEQCRRYGTEEKNAGCF